MAVVALFAMGERLEAPAPLGWRWRGPERVLRFVGAHAMALRRRPRLEAAGAPL
jgi:hypothetical protein